MAELPTGANKDEQEFFTALLGSAGQRTPRHVCHHCGRNFTGDVHKHRCPPLGIPVPPAQPTTHVQIQVSGTGVGVKMPTSGSRLPHGSTAYRALVLKAEMRWTLLTVLGFSYGMLSAIAGLVFDRWSFILLSWGGILIAAAPGIYLWKKQMAYQWRQWRNRRALSRLAHYSDLQQYPGD